MSVPVSERPHPQALPELSRPKVERRVLANGLTLLVQEDRAHPLAAFQATARTGSANEGAFLGAGVSHVLEHMLFKGTARRPVGAFEAEARAYGGTMQGFTTHDTTGYQVVVNKEFWAEGADLLVDALFFPSLDPEEFVKERQVVLRELKLRGDDPEHQIWDLLFENAYRVHPYRVPIIGMEPLLTALTREETIRYHRDRYRPNGIVISVIGDISTDAVIQRIEQLTQGISPGPVPFEPLAQEPLPVAPRETTQEAQVHLGMVALGFPGVETGHPDGYALDLLTWILGGGRGSILEKRLKDPGIVHSVGCFNYTPRERGLFVVTMRMDPDRVSVATEKLEEELARAQKESFDSAEIEAAKKVFLREYLAQRQTVEAQAADLAAGEVLVGDPTFSYAYLKEIDKLQGEDLQRVAHRYLNLKQVTIVKLVPEGTQGTTVSPEKETGPSSAELSDAEKFTLKNGLRVLLKPDHRSGLVTFQIALLGGVRWETEATNGVSLLAARMLLRGTLQKKADQISDEIKRMGAELEPFSGRNSLGLTLQVVSLGWPSAVELLNELLAEPTFPSEELEKERKLLLAGLKAKEEDPFPWGSKRLYATLFTVHPYRLDPSGNSKSVAALTSEELEAFYAKVLDPRQMVVAAVGDFKRDELLADLEKTLGRIPLREAQTVSVPQEPSLTAKREHRESNPRQEGLLMIGFPGLKITDSRVAALDLVEAVLSGGAGRLFFEIRDRKGLAYTVGASAVHGVDPGAVILYAVSDPAELKTVEEGLWAEVRRLGAVPIPEEELARAKQGLLGDRRRLRQSPGSQASQMAADELYGLGFDFSSRYEAQVAATTAKEIQRLAQEILSPERAVVVIGEPESP